MKRVILFLLVSSVALLAEAKTWFVATNGRDGSSGSAAQPFATITKAAKVAKPGDVVNVRGGVYKGVVRIEAKGTRAKQIIIRAAPGEQPVIDGDGTKAGTDLVQLINVQWLQFTGFEVRRSTGVGIFAWGATNTTIASNKVHDCARAAIWAGFERPGVSANLTITGNTVFDNVLTNRKHARSGGWPQAIGVYKSERVTVSGNRVYRNHGEGIAFIVSDRCTATGNEVSDNFSVNIYLDNAQWATVERNLVYSSGDQRFFRFGQPAFGIGTANEHYDVVNSLEYLTIVNNIIVRTRSAIYYGNYDRGGGLRNSIIANNTCYQSTEALLRISRSSRHRATLVANNIFMQPDAVNALADVVTNGITFMNNAWNRARQGSAAGEGDVIGDVKLANPGGAGANDYRITPGSPCIDAGTPVPSLRDDYFEKRRSGKPDIGATELPY